MASWGLWIAYGWPLGVSGCTVIQMGHESTTQPLARPFAHLLTLLTHLFSLRCLLCSHTLLRTFVHLLTHSHARGKVDDYMSQNQAVLNHSGMAFWGLGVASWCLLMASLGLWMASWGYWIANGGHSVGTLDLFVTTGNIRVDLWAL